VEKINLVDMLEFNTEKSIRKGIFKAGDLDTGLLLYAPGQTTPDHRHSDIDEIFYVVLGNGIITINNEALEIKQEDVILSLHGETHGFYNNSKSNLVVLQIKSSL
jgi:quercetin dioxygenase-like cupin family protein